MNKQSINFISFIKFIYTYFIELPIVLVYLTIKNIPVILLFAGMYLFVTHGLAFVYSIIL